MRQRMTNPFDHQAEAFGVFTIQVWDDGEANLILPDPNRSTEAAWRETTFDDLRRSMARALDWLDTITIEEGEGCSE